MALVMKVKIGGRVRVRLNGVDVWVQVYESGLGGTRLSFEAPREVHIVREEVLPDAERYAAVGRNARLAALAVTPTPAG